MFRRENSPLFLGHLGLLVCPLYGSLSAWSALLTPQILVVSTMEPSEAPETQVDVLFCMHAQQQQSPLAVIRACSVIGKKGSQSLGGPDAGKQLPTCNHNNELPQCIGRCSPSLDSSEGWRYPTNRPATFCSLVDVCWPYMERQVTCMWQTIAIEGRVGMALFKLCSTAEYRTVDTLFGIGRSTVNELYLDFCETIVSVFEPKWVKLMTPKELPEHIQEF
ncbi:uncharacterized protein ISCGN_027397 [Ixodes scapularis]